MPETTQSPPENLADALVSLLAAGLPQDRATLDVVRASLGATDDLAALARLAAEPEEAEHAPLVALLLSPGRETRLALEPLLAAADLDEDGTTALAEAVASRLAGQRVLALLPDGARARLAAEPDALRAFVRRLRPQATAPASLRAILNRRFAPERALELALALRHSRLAWTAEREFFLAALLERADPRGAVGSDDLPGLVAWAAGFLEALGTGEAGARPDLRLALAARRQALLAQLRQAEVLEEALARGSYEILMSQGLRPGHVHAPDVRAGLAFLERSALLALGLSPGALDGLAGVAVRDLGGVEDAGELVRLLGAPEG